MVLRNLRSMKMRGRYSPKRSKRRGSAIVEMALVIPVMLLLMVGIMEFGWLVYSNLVLANATREAARAASIGQTTTVVRNMITTRCRPMVVTTTIEYSLNSGPYTAVTDSSGGVNAAPTGAMMRVATSTGFRPLTGMLPLLKNRSIKSQAEFGRE